MKTAIVTGATGNLGQAMIGKFLKEGYAVIGTTSKPSKTPFDGKPGFEVYSVDLSNEEQTSSFMVSLLQKYPVIDVAVLTAGGFGMGKIEESGMDDLLHHYKLNFQTTYNPARLIFMQMLNQRKGRIFMTGSKPGLDMKNGKGVTGYALSKSLVFRLAELMNEEAKNSSVVTHVIVPSTIDTPENRKAMPNGDFDKWVTPENIAEIIFAYCGESFEMVREGVIKIYNRA
ncbi:MAG: short-chain dehydrogenase [Citrobacter freundii]|nr:MAG: short-chain dehydrogenase [Citrobacter freundii]